MFSHGRVTCSLTGTCDVFSHRDVYYEAVWLYETKAAVDRCTEDTARTLATPRRLLHLTATGEHTWQFSPLGDRSSHTGVVGSTEFRHDNSALRSSDRSYDGSNLKLMVDIIIIILLNFIDTRLQNTIGMIIKMQMDLCVLTG